MKRLFVLLGLLSSFFVQAQEQTQKFGIKFKGYIRTETFWDSRQTATSREGNVPLYPKAEVLDKKDKDINSQPSFNMMTIVTRMKAVVSAPDVLGAKTSGAIEIDFLGNADGTINMPRMRHAFIKLNWDKMEILTGQYWHPMFPVECYPDVIAWGAALPVAPLSRAPQMRFTYKPTSDFRISLAALSQRDFSSTGPAGRSSEYLRNSAIPELQFQFVGGASSNFKYGFTAGYKTLVPRLVNELKQKVDETVSSYNFNAFAKYKNDKFSVALQGLYGQDLYQFIMLGGYAIAKDGSSFNLNPAVNTPAVDDLSYTNVPAGSVWTEIEYKFKPFSAALFAGYTKNFGAEEEVYQTDAISTVFARGSDIDYIYRIAPRVAYKVGKFKFVGEVTRTTAAYGTPDEELKVQDSEEISSYRYLVSAFLFF